MPHSAQLAFNLPFDSARWKGAKYSQYFGLSLKPGNQWCFLLIREFVGKCSWNFRGSSSLVCLDLVIADARSAGESIAQYLTLPKVGCMAGFFTRGCWSKKGLPFAGSRLSLGVVGVKRVIFLIGSVIGGVEAKRGFLLGGCSGVDYYWRLSKSRGSFS
ncbi:hypothetical protein EDB89DRAFT_1913835 [Lactarius sanguifluus]|nr:hypothetical protein EDB89DRAFT_1913835 [Lactarius sanguifluus]